MKYKEVYTFTELLDNLKIPVSEFCRRAHVTEGTIGNIKKGHAIRRSTVNKLLGCLSEIYERELSLENVEGLNLENRLAAEEPVKVPVDTSMPIDMAGGKALQISPTTRKPGGAPKSDIPAELPEGTVKLFDFIKENDLSGSNISKYVNNGYKGEKIETTTIPRASGLGGVSHFLTPEQQVKAIALLKKWGKWKKQDQSTQQEKPWYSPDSE